MKKRILFYAALTVSLLSLITIIVLAAGISNTTGNEDFGIHISYITSIALIGFTAGMALNIYYFITSGTNAAQTQEREKTKLFEEICLYDAKPACNEGKYSLFIIRPNGFYPLRELIPEISALLTAKEPHFFQDSSGRLLVVIIKESRKSPKEIAESITRKAGNLSYSISYYPDSIELSYLNTAYLKTVRTAERLFFLEPESILETNNVEDETISYAQILQNIESAMQNLKKDDARPLLSLLDNTKGNFMACRFAFFMISSLLDQQRLIVNPSMHPGTMDIRDFSSFTALQNYINEKALGFIRDKEAKSEYRQESYTKQIEELIQMHLPDSGYGVQQIADDLGLSSAYISRIYKEKIGRNIIDTITEMRLSKAEDLLTNTDKTIAEICMESGYSSSSYFHRVFRKRHLISPGEYRQKMKENQK